MSAHVGASRSTKRPQGAARARRSPRPLRLELTRALSAELAATTERILAQAFWSLPVSGGAQVVALAPRLAEAGAPKA